MEGVGVNSGDSVSVGSRFGREEVDRPLSFNEHTWVVKET